eukprot:gene5036-6266_t
MYLLTGDKGNLMTCDNIYRNVCEGIARQSRTSKRITFLEGPYGIYSIGAVLNDRLGDTKQSDELLLKVLQISQTVIQDRERGVSYEILYGKCGYLQCLLFIYKQKQIYLDGSLKKQLEGAIKALVIDTVQFGMEFSAKEHSQSPLMYEWHSSKYLGAAHGLAGILYMLMDSLEVLNHDNEIDENSFFTKAKQLMRDSIDYLVTCQFPSSGNFPSRKENTEDKLVQWCHGAPGIIPTLIKSSQFFGEPSYLQVAEIASRVIWTKGLLKKGVGLCHSISGNAYSFLLLYQSTHKLQYLYQVVEFTKLCCNEQFFKQLHTPDNPLSLFEGDGGLAWLLQDLIFLKSKGQENLKSCNFNFPTY